MRNSVFHIEFNKLDGTLLSLKLVDDSDNMNWCAEDGRWGYVHHINYDNIWGDYQSRQKEMRLIEFSDSDLGAKSVYSNEILQVTVERSFDNYGNLNERFTFKNLAYADLFLSGHNCSIEVPFNDRYTYADDCLIHKCDTHIWCGLDTTYINALKMGVSDKNVGLVVTKGAFDGYSVLGCDSNNRGRFLLNPASFVLMYGEEYVIEWVIFRHSGKNDFRDKAFMSPNFIDIRAEHHTLFQGEPIRFTVGFGHFPENIRIYDKFGEIKYSAENRELKVEYFPQNLGEYRIFVEADGTVTYADFLVKEDFKTLLARRVDFIVANQQYQRKGSPLDGAFLIYDNKNNHMIFEDCIPDHNACQERIGMGLLLARYLQVNKNEKVYTALMKYVAFVKREFYDESDGYVYTTVGKDRSKIRLYNAPWVSTLFTELYYLTKDKGYLREVLRLLKVYYAMGGDKFYPNGISILRTADAFRTADMKAEYCEIFDMFKNHVDNMVENGVSYPRHEVNFEQTIVSPAATFISEFAILSGEKKYKDAAKTHIEILERFSGSQPSFHLNEIPIRYWDDYWFGKFMIKGDTFPHYWSCLTARSFYNYYMMSGDKKYLASAEECMRNCMCLFADDGCASAAYIYPRRLGARFGEMYDEWANDQDFALYFALETGLLTKEGA